MTHTVQPHSAAVSGETGETEDNESLLLFLEDSLMNLSIALKKLNKFQINLCQELTTLEQIVHNI